MAYVRGAAAAKAEAIQRRKEAVLAEAMRAEAELDALLKNEQDLQRAERRREKALTDLRQVRDKFTAAAEAAEADVTEMIELRAQIARDAKKAAAAAERIKRELVRAEAADADLRRLQSEHARNARKLHDKNQSAADKIIQISRPRIELPPPIYGGPEGLRAAADEADRRGITTHKRPKAA
jgi:chromosome segregation ATPase